MPKSKDKTKGATKRKKTPVNSGTNTESDGEKPNTKKKKVQKKCNKLEGISMSKQLAAEVQKKKSVRSRNSSKKSNEPRLLGNGKPMPSLQELEAMYADSDDDENEAPKSITTSPERCSTPLSKPIVIDKVNLDSPETLKKVASQVIEIISKKIIVDDEGPPPPVIPQKKPKKGDKPYIVGCKDRPQVPWAPKTKFCVGQDDYGIDPNQLPDDEPPQKRKKRGKPVNLSKSIFNAKTDEIVEMLQAGESSKPQRNYSPDSNKTVDYFDSNSPKTNSVRSFSPLPSSSKDSETILKNDQLFNESLYMEPISNKLSPKNDSQDIEVIEPPCETVVIHDSLPNQSLKADNHYSDIDDDEIVFVESEIKKKKTSETQPPLSPKDEIYASIDLTEPYLLDNEVYEINDDDIDTLIAENKALLQKDTKRINNIDKVTAVDTSTILVESQSNIPKESVIISPLSRERSANNDEVFTYSPEPAECEEIQATVPDSNNNPTPAPSQSTGVGVDRNAIALVVDDFFKHNKNTANMRTPNKNTATIDLTSSTPQNTIMSRIFSWVSSIETYLTGNAGRQNSLQGNVNDDVVVLVEDADLVEDHSRNVEPTSRTYDSAHHPNLISRNVSPRSLNNIRSEAANNCSMGLHSNTPNGPTSTMNQNLLTSCEPICYPQGPFSCIRTNNHMGGNMQTPYNTSCCSRRGALCTCAALPNPNHSGLATHPTCGMNNCSSTGTYNFSSNSQMEKTIQKPSVTPFEQHTSLHTVSQPSPPRRGFGDCPICMDSLANSSVASTMCGHVFCMPCIRAAIRANGKKCPTCRKALKGVGYHQIFI